MSYADEQKAIEGRFSSMFTACPVKYTNVAFTATAGTTFAELQIYDSYSRRAEIGGNLHRSTGQILVRVFVPKGQGSVTGRTIADKAATVFRGQSFSGITCRSPVIMNAGEHQEWYAVVMMCPFYRDKIY